MLETLNLMLLIVVMLVQNLNTVPMLQVLRPIGTVIWSLYTTRGPMNGQCRLDTFNTLILIWVVPDFFIKLELHNLLLL